MITDVELRAAFSITGRYSEIIAIFLSHLPPMCPAEDELHSFHHGCGRLLRRKCISALFNMFNSFGAHRLYLTRCSAFAGLEPLDEQPEAEGWITRAVTDGYQRYM